VTVVEALAIIRASWELIDRIIAEIQEAKGKDIPEDKAKSIRQQALDAHNRLSESLNNGRR
jgi:hypothetical protein